MSTPSWIAGMDMQPLHWRDIREFIADAGPDSHFANSFEGWTDARFHFTPMIGYSARDLATGKLIGAGGVVWVGRIEPHAFFAVTPEFATDLRRSRWVHRPALWVLDVAHSVSETIYSWPDPEVPAAERWMRRLGFEPPTPETKGLWTHAVSRTCHSGDHGRPSSSRRVHHGERDPAGAVGGRDGDHGLRAD